MADYTRITVKSTVEIDMVLDGAGAVKKSTVVSNISLSPIQGDTVENNEYVGSWQPGKPSNAGKWTEITFTTPFRGTAILGKDPPCEDLLFKACGIDRADTGASPDITKNTYTMGDPHLTTGDPAGKTLPVEIYFNQDRHLVVLANCVGNAVFNFPAGQLPSIDWTFRGQWLGVDGAETAHSAFERGIEAVPVQGWSATMTGSTSGTAGTLIISDLTFDCGNIIDPRPSITGTGGYSGPLIIGRRPLITVQIEENLLATANWVEMYELGEAITFDITCSVDALAAAGHVTDIDFAGFLSEMPERTELNGKYVWSLTLSQDPTDVLEFTIE